MSNFYEEPKEHLFESIWNVDIRHLGSWADPEGDVGSRPPWKITSGHMFSLNYWYTDHPQETIRPIGSNCFLREVRTSLCKIR